GRRERGEGKLPPHFIVAVYLAARHRDPTAAIPILQLKSGQAVERERLGLGRRVRGRVVVVQTVEVNLIYGPAAIEVHLQRVRKRAPGGIVPTLAIAPRPLMIAVDRSGW